MYRQTSRMQANKDHVSARGHDGETIIQKDVMLHTRLGTTLWMYLIPTNKQMNKQMNEKTNERTNSSDKEMALGCPRRALAPRLKTVAKMRNRVTNLIAAFSWNINWTFMRDYYGCSSHLIPTKSHISGWETVAVPNFLFFKYIV